VRAHRLWKGALSFFYRFIVFEKIPAGQLSV